MIIKNISARVRLLSLILAITLICASLSSCFLFVKEEMPPKEEIESNIASSDLDFPLVCQYLSDWGIVGFDMAKFITYESVIATNYNYEPMPETHEHAKAAARDFLANYYDTINLNDKTAVTDALLKCYVAAIGDPYAVYRPPVQTDNYQTEMSGEFGGIGVMIEYNHTDKQIIVSGVTEGGPSEKAGLASGDIITAIDDKVVDESNYREAVDFVRGKVGTTVKITVKRGEESLSFSIVREKIVEASVSYKIIAEDNIGYVKISSFKGNTAEQFRSAIDALEAAKVAGIVFDLRSNGGGLLQSVCDVVSYLVPTGQTVVSYRYKNRPTEVMKTTNDGDKDHVVTLPMTVICNAGTASAAEIFTAAIRDYRAWNMLEATIVGTTTYKKGIMQATFKPYLLDGSTVTMTVAFYDPPCGINYHGIGVTPDVHVELPTPELDPESGKYLPVEDTQYNRAIEELLVLINAN